jgi:hypothetical protein
MVGGDAWSSRTRGRRLNAGLIRRFTVKPFDPKASIATINKKTIALLVMLRVSDWIFEQRTPVDDDSSKLNFFTETITRHSPTSSPMKEGLQHTTDERARDLFTTTMLDLDYDLW